jgi:ABC-type antimicrobial peptide transport system permease subunit
VARRFAEEADWRGSLSAFVSGLDMTPFATSRIALQQPVLTRQNVKAYFESRGYFSLESRQLLLDSETVRAAEAAANETYLRAAPTLIYLADSISDGNQTTSYALVASLDPSLKPPLGPFLPSGMKKLDDEDILLVQPDRPILPGRSGDPIKLSYYDPENENELRTADFRLAGFLPLQGAADDPFLTPEFPGITDRTTIDQWNPPPQIHFDNRRVKKPDDEWFWDEFRTTPKAYVTLHRGEQLWGKSRFGKYTSIRLDHPKLPPELQLGKKRRITTMPDVTETAKEYRKVLLRHLKPERVGLAFDPIAEQRLAASRGGQDFGMLFLGFSIFLIVAAMLLVGLLFRLNLDQRASEIGILFATGFSKRKVRRLLLAEGSVLVAAGGLIGLAGAVFYAALLLRLLRAWWPGGLEQSVLTLHLGESNGMSFIIGYLASFIVSILTIAWTVRVLGKLAPRQLLSGQTGDEELPRARRARWSWWVAAVSGVSALALAGSARWFPQGEMQAMIFFTSGLLLLVAVLAVIWALFKSSRMSAMPRNAASLRVGALGSRNAARHPVRSILTTGLLACAAFLLVAVQSFHRQPEKDFLDKDSGSGGFALLAEIDAPLFHDLNNEKVRREQLDLPASAASTLQGVTFDPFRLRAGDDVSCLNLYQARRPRLLGAPPAFIRRGGFRFASSEAQTEDQRRNPWLLLDQPIQENVLENVVPVIADATTAEWVLHKKLGEVLEIPDERGGNVIHLRIVALLQDSIFQSELLMSEANFLTLYPHQEGYNFYLVATPADRVEDVKDLLQTTLAQHGVEVTETIDRLRSYMAVENTYLLTFQALGGLGLLLGALGLAVVLLRSVWERRSELALLRALGYRKRALGWLVLAENGLLLVLGLAGGTLSALLAVAPHLAGVDGRLPWLEIAGLLAAVLVVGLVAETAAVAATLRAPLVAALRRE